MGSYRKKYNIVQEDSTKEECVDYYNLVATITQVIDYDNLVATIAQVIDYDNPVATITR